MLTKRTAAMSDAHLNLIDGTWMPGDHLTENRNPSDLSDHVRN